MPQSFIVAVLLDDVFSINPNKDSSFAMMLEAQRKNYIIYCFDSHQMSLDKHGVYAQAIQVLLTDSETNFIQIITHKKLYLNQAQVILMRKNPPFDMNYIYATYLLEIVENQGVMVVNKPQSLRDFNEKLSILQFPNCITNTLVSSDIKAILAFLAEHKTIVIKPLDGMGGVDIFKLSHTDITNNAIQKIKQLTQNQTPLMAQKFLPEIKNGDKRIIIINGKPIDYALARIPAKGSWKGNLAQGAIGVAQALTKQDYHLCQQIAPTLQEKGLLFVGLDVIGNYITEINITSPTGICELNKQCGLNIAASLFDVIEQCHLQR